MSEHKSYCFKCGQKNFKTIEESGTKCGRCGEETRVNKEFFTVFTQPGKEIEEKDVPIEVLKAFRKLAVDIVKSVEYMAKNADIVDDEYTVKKTRKIAVC